MSRFLFRSAFGLCALLVAACAVNPATGERELSLIGEGREVEMGREAQGQVVASMGLVDDEGLQAYVDGLGKELAAVSERPDLPWSFQVVDDPVVNAFALPGGFIFVTRGILAHFDSEAELAGVLGHEIGHVTARHSVRQMSRQQLQLLGLGVGALVWEDVGEYTEILAAGLGLLNLKYSRGDETQSDELGATYMHQVGYDPQALVGVFEMLATVSGGAQGRAPEWQLTHPYPENRESHIREITAELPGGTPRGAGLGVYLDRIQGLVYGVNPREGYFRGDRFLHPELAFQMDFPSGWSGVNQRAAVGAVSPDESAVVVLELEDSARSPLTALRAFLSQEGVEGGRIQEDDAYGIPRARARFSTGSEEESVEGEVLFLSHGGQVYRILGAAPAGRWGAVSAQVSAALGSFAPVTDAAVLNVRPWRLDVVRVPEAMTLAAFHRRYPSVVDVDEVARLNRVSPDETIPAGTRVKRVVGTPLP